MKIDFVEWAALLCLRNDYKEKRDILIEKLAHAHQPDECTKCSIEKCRGVIQFLDKKLHEYESEVTNNKCRLTDKEQRG